MKTNRFLKIWRSGLNVIKLVVRTSIIFLIALSFFAVSTGEARTPSYKSVLKKWTRQEEVYTWDNFEARVVWYATYQSEKFRKVRVQKYAKLYDLDKEQVTNLLEQEKKDDQKYDTFFVSIYANGSTNSRHWRLILTTEGGKKVKPVSMESVPDDQILRHLYPYVDRWSKTFEVRFPKVTQKGQSFELKVVGIPDHSKMVWKK